MKKIVVLLTLLLVEVTYSQSVLMTVDKDTIYTSVFEKRQKNSLEKLGVKQTVDNYINFSLLKQYALKYKVDESQDFQIQLLKEGEKLKDSLYYPSEELEPLLKDYYQKLMKERAVQILVFKDDILREKEKQREKFINGVIKKINNDPLAFQEAVEQHSSTQLYKKSVYFDVFSLGKSVVDMIYEAPVGKVTKFVSKDNYYYLILVSDERKYLGNVVLDDILIKDTTEEGRLKAETVYDEIQKNGDFLGARQKYSQNLEESKNINPFNFYSDMKDKQLYQYVSNVINSNDPSNTSITVFPPIKTEQGYVIYKYLFRESYDTYSQARSKLYARLKKSGEINRLNNDLVKKLKTELDYHENTQNIEKFIQSLPKDYKDFKDMKLDNEDLLVNIGDSYTLTTQDLLSLLKGVEEQDYPEIEEGARYMINTWENKAILDYYKEHFFEMNDFKEDWKNLEDQSLIRIAFAIITSQAQQDVEGQKEFLKKEASKYTWKERIQGTFYYCLNSDVEKEVVQMLKSKKSVDYIKNYFKGKTDSDNNELLVVDKGKLSREALNLPSDVNLSDNMIYTIDRKNRKLVMNVEKVIKDDPMSLEELQTTYINEYIDYKTAKVMEQLRKEAKININESQEEILEKKYGL